MLSYSSLAQSVEHAAVNRVVVGSSPTRGAKKRKTTLCVVFLFLFYDGGLERTVQTNSPGGLFVRPWLFLKKDESNTDVFFVLLITLHLIHRNPD